MELPELVEFDYSVRANLANSSVCGDVRPSVVLKLQLKEADGSERQVVLELDEAQLSSMLRTFASASKALKALDESSPS